MNEFEIAEAEARKIQEAIELLNKHGFEHHIANHILQKELEIRENRAWLNAVANGES